MDPEGRREQSAPGKQLACPPAGTVSRSAIAGAGAPAGPARRGESPAATAPPHALPRRREPGAGRGRSWRCLRADPLARVLRCIGRLSHRPGLRRGPAEAAPACEQRANEAGAQRRAAGAGVRRAAEEGRRLMNINRAAA